VFKVFCVLGRVRAIYPSCELISMPFAGYLFVLCVIYILSFFLFFLFCILSLVANKPKALINDKCFSRYVFFPIRVCFVVQKV
jgi:hypothetical protein